MGRARCCSGSVASFSRTHSPSLSLSLCFSLTFNRKRSIVHAHPSRGYRRKNRVTNDAKVFARGVTRVFSRSARLEGWLHFRLITPYFPIDCMCGSGGGPGNSTGHQKSELPLHYFINTTKSRATTIVLMVLGLCLSIRTPMHTLFFAYVFLFFCDER